MQRNAEVGLFAKPLKIIINDAMGVQKKRKAAFFFS
jgi:hypothetical protein|tara:strand:+ start:19793 stop:19900 length:108 start_codon:yes stop_codon:yes gene_type:complete